MDKEKVKLLIECSTSFEKADEIMKNHTDCKSDKERIEYLKEMFDVEIISRTDDDIHTDYVSILTSIVENKWN